MGGGLERAATDHPLTSPVSGGSPPRATVARAGTPPSGRDLSILAVFSLGTFAAAAAQHVLLEASDGSGSSIEMSVGELFAVAAIIRCLLTFRTGGVALTRRDVGLLVAAAVPWLVFEEHAIFLSFTIAGLAIYARGTARPILGDLAQVWLAVSAYELWGKLLFKLVAPWVIALETGLVASVGRMIMPGLTMRGIELRTGADWSIYIREGCSSFHNMSLAVLIWLSVLRIGDAPIDRGALRALAESIALVVAANVARILLMIPSREAYLFWHEGVGSALAACATVLACALPVVGRMRHRPRPRLQPAVT